MDATLLDVLWAMGYWTPCGLGVLDALRAMGYWVWDNGQWREGKINVLQHIKKNK